MKDTKALSTENGDEEEILGLEGGCFQVCPREIRHEGNFHKHTQMFAEGLYTTGELTGKKIPSITGQDRTKSALHSLLPHWLQLANAVCLVRAISSISQLYYSVIIPSALLA